MSDAVQLPARESRGPARARGVPLVMTARAAGDWVLAGGRESTPAARLFCFPHAGGSYVNFSGWRERLPADIEILSFCYPGRLRLIRGEPLASIGTLVAAVAVALAGMLDVPFILHGHSVGALVGFELARHLRRRSGPRPAALIVSGRAAPQLPRTEPDLAALPADRLIAELIAMEGLPPGLEQSAELIALVLPSIRADLSINETYVYDHEPPLDVPLLALAGQSDPQVVPATVEAWRSQTTSTFAFETVPGGHFFPASGQDAMLALIRQTLHGWLDGSGRAE